MAAALLIIGAALVVTGVALVCIPAAFVLGGVFCIAYGALMEYAAAPKIEEPEVEPA